MHGPFAATTPLPRGGFVVGLPPRARGIFAIATYFQPILDMPASGAGNLRHRNLFATYFSFSNADA